jgi:uncharacterized protein (DUF3084 family)
MTLAELLKAKGFDDESVKAFMEEMKANKIFTANEENLDVRYGKLKTDHDGKVAELTEAQNLIAELKKSNKGNEDLQGKVTAYETQVARLQAELEQARIESEAKVGLLAAKALDVDYLLFKLKEKGELSRGEDGKVKGLDDMIDALKTQFPTQFESTSTKHYQEHRLPEGDPGDKPVTKEEFNKMGYNSRVELKRNNPEQYSQLMKG